MLRPSSLEDQGISQSALLWEQYTVKERESEALAAEAKREKVEWLKEATQQPSINLKHLVVSPFNSPL